MKNSHKYILFFTVFFMVSTSFCQSKEDSMKNWEENFELGYQFFSQNNYQDAKTYFGKALESSEKIKDTLPYAVVNTNYYYAASLFKLNDFSNSISYFEKTLVETKQLPEPNLDFEILLSTEIANVYSTIGDFKSAITKQESLISFIKDRKGELSDVYASNVNNLGQMFFELGDCGKATTYYNTAKEIYSKLNLRTIDVATVYNNLGLCYFSSGDYPNANIAYLEAFDIVEEIDQIGTYFYSKLISNIAALGHVEGDYDNAKLLHEQSLSILFDLNLGQTIEYAEGLFAYAQLLKDLGMYDNALFEVKNAKFIYDKYLAPNHIRFANLKSVLAEIYLNKGDTKEALKNYEQSLKLFQELKQENNAGYGYALNGLGTTYQILGDYNKSIEYYLEALKSLEISLTKNHKDYGITLMNVGNVLATSGDYKRAYMYLEEAIPVFKSTIGTDNIKYAHLCVNILKVAFQNPEEDLSELDFLIDFTLGIFERIDKTDNVFYNYTKFYKAVIEMENKKFKKALDILLNIEKDIENKVDDDSLMYNDVITLIAINYDLLNEYDNALNYYQKYNTFLLKSVSEVFTFRSEKDKKIYLDKLEFWFSTLTKISLDKNFSNQEITTLSLDNQLLIKGLLLNSSKNIVSQLSTLKDTLIDSKLNTFKTLKNLKNRLQLRQDKTVNSELQQVNANINTIETELVELYNKKFDTNLDYNKDWKTIKSNLKPNEVAIEFVSYLKSQKITNAENTKYIAYVIKNTSEYPEVIELFSELELKTVLSQKTPNQLYKTRGSKGRSVSSTIDLYDVIWKPLDVHLQDVKTIYFSPVGLLNQVPFAALSNEGELLNEKYNLVQLSSTCLVAESSVEPRQDNTLFIGGIDYDFIAEATTKSIENSEFDFLSNKKGTRSLGSSWNYLSGTLEEVNAISNLFKKNNKTATVISKQEATEASFKDLSSKSPNVMHIATHGFFFEDVSRAQRNALDLIKESVYKTSEDPLMRSGLILAGANYAWKHGSNPHTKENGILTAAEISNLDLSNTDMVVLSACETGLGDIEGSEGVYGLQRAFKMAGVDIIIMSLWEVPDKETSEFMQLFYSNWLGGMKVREAFRDTQRNMSTKYKDTPKKWAAFVLFE